MNRRLKNFKGFTLIEILIAVLIFAIVISILLSSYKAFIVSSETVKNELTHIETIQAVFKRISMDLEAVFVLQPPRYKKPEFDSDPDPYRFIGKKEAIGQMAASSMMFTSCAHAKLGADPRNGVSRIAYYLKKNKNNRFDLYRADSLPPFSEISEPCSDHVLCRDISEFQIIYTDHNGNDHDDWDSDTEEFKYTFPASIDLKITFGSGESRRLFTASINLAAERNPID